MLDPTTCATNHRFASPVRNHLRDRSGAPPDSNQSTMASYTGGAGLLVPLLLMALWYEWRGGILAVLVELSLSRNSRCRDWQIPKLRTRCLVCRKSSVPNPGEHLRVVPRQRYASRLPFGEIRARILSGLPNNIFLGMRAGRSARKYTGTRQNIVKIVIRNLLITYPPKQKTILRPIPRSGPDICGVFNVSAAAERRDSGKRCVSKAALSPSVPRYPYTRVRPHEPPSV